MYILYDEFDVTTLAKTKRAGLVANVTGLIFSVILWKLQMLSPLYPVPLKFVTSPTQGLEIDIYALWV